MNQTRFFLILAWMMVAVLLWMQWSGDKSAPASSETPTAPAAVSTAAPSSIPTSGIPQAAVAGTPSDVSPASVGAARNVRIVTDVLDLEFNGTTVNRALLLGYPQSKDAGSEPVGLFNADSSHPYVAVSGWGTEQGSVVPDMNGFVAENNEETVRLVDGKDEVTVAFRWKGEGGVEIRRTLTLGRGSYALNVSDDVINNGSATWQGFVYRRLDRTPAPMSRGMTNPDSFSFNGATWYDSSYERRAFDDDYLDDGTINQAVQGGWMAMLQHHFFSAWIPQSDQTSLFLLSKEQGRYSVESRGPGFVLAPGQKATTAARLWVGPKLVEQIESQGVKGLDRVVDYSRFDTMALIGKGLFWVLNKVHSLVLNWGWAIVGLVVLLRLVMYPLSAAQFRSGAKMRAVQPRIAQLKERHGEDRQKFQMAMMDLYKKEKINPLGGCLPLLIQMPIFFALYWVLVESVELRQAPWFAWIQDLTARDPYFILPIINVAVMWATQKLTPMNGVDPMQAKIMQFMPLIFGVMMAFMPAGLVLYWVVNGGLGLLQQWLMIRKYPAPTTAVAAK